MSINKKGKLGQFLCRHTNHDWYVQESKFQIISGERQYKICEDCGKVLDERFLRYEGMGFK